MNFNKNGRGGRGGRPWRKAGERSKDETGLTVPVTQLLKFCKIGFPNAGDAHVIIYAGNCSEPILPQVNVIGLMGFLEEEKAKAESARGGSMSEVAALQEKLQQQEAEIAKLKVLLGPE